MQKCIANLYQKWMKNPYVTCRNALDKNLYDKCRNALKICTKNQIKIFMLHLKNVFIKSYKNMVYSMQKCIK